MRRQGTHYRDKTFDFFRRFYGKLFSTDIDAIEYYNFEPIDMREYKSRQSGWKNGKNASVVVQAKLAQRAGIPYYVVEHDMNWETADVYKVASSDSTYTISDPARLTLQKYFAWLYRMRGLKVPSRLPVSFDPITRKKVILYLWDDLSQDEKQHLLQELKKRP